MMDLINGKTVQTQMHRQRDFLLFYDLKNVESK